MFLNFCFYFFSCFPIGTASSAIGLKICVITAGSKTYKKSIIKKKWNKNDKIVLLANTNYKVLVNNVLIEYDDLKEEIKNLKILTAHQGF